MTDSRVICSAIALVFLAYIGHVSWADTSSSAVESELETALRDAYVDYMVTVEESQEKDAFGSRQLIAEPIANDLVNRFGVDLLPVLEERVFARLSRIKNRSTAEKEWVGHGVEWMAIAKLGEAHDVSQVFVRYAMESAQMRALVSESYFLPLEQIRKVSEGLVDNNIYTNKNWRMMTAVGDEKTLERLEQPNRTEGLLVDDIGIRFMRTRLRQSEDVQLQWIGWDVKYMQWKNGLFGKRMMSASATQFGLALSRAVASDADMRPTYEYLEAIADTAELDRDPERRSQYAAHCLALSERGDEESIILLRRTGMAHGRLLLSALPGFGAEFATPMFEYLIQPGAEANLAFVERTLASRDPKTVARLEALIGDDGFAVAEVEALEAARLQVLQNIGQDQATK